MLLLGTVLEHQELRMLSNFEEVWERKFLRVAKER